MLKKYLLSVSIGLLMVGSAGTAFASPILFSDNGNYYELINDPMITWTKANDAANNSSHNGITGHLATITSQAENDFIFNDLGVKDQPAWLGGFQAVSVIETTNREEWQWVTEESWTYSNWANREPNNSNVFNDNGEDVLAFAFYKADGSWNDAPINFDRYSNGAYVVEYEGAAPVPEPATMILFGAGLIGLAGFQLRKKKK